jgi:hypothetical protein
MCDFLSSPFISFYAEQKDKEDANAGIIVGFRMSNRF